MRIRLREKDDKTRNTEGKRELAFAEMKARLAIQLTFDVD